MSEMVDEGARTIFVTEMVDQVARAIFVTIWNDDPSRFHPAYEHDRDLWEKAARAAIDVIEAMLNAALERAEL